MDEDQVNLLLERFDRLLDLLDEHFLHIDKHLRERGVLVPNSADPLRTHAVRAGLKALRVDNAA
jgi:hypothetical protein